MKPKTKTLSKLCEEQKPFFIQKFDTTPEEKEKIIKEVVKEYMDHVNKLYCDIKIVEIRRQESKLYLKIKKLINYFTNI